MSQCGSGSDTSSSLLAWVPVAPLKTRDGVGDGRTDGFGSGSTLSMWKGYGLHTMESYTQSPFRSFNALNIYWRKTS